MTQIKKVKTSEGVQFYPQTHTKAVIDDNGYTAESRLGAMQDEINNLQEGVVVVGEGVTPVPSDLTPTEDSTNWVTSGGVYNADKAIHERIDEIVGGNVVEFQLTGAGSTYVEKTFSDLIAGHTYKITLTPSDYSVSTISTNINIYGCYYKIGNDSTNVFVTNRDDTRVSEKMFVAVDADYYGIGIRADSGVVVSFTLQDMSDKGIISDIKDTITELVGDYTESFSLIGTGTTTSSVHYLPLTAGTRYKITVSPCPFPYSNAQSGYNIYSVGYRIRNTDTNMFSTIAGKGSVPESYIFTAVEADTYYVLIRAAENNVVSFEIKNLDIDEDVIVDTEPTNGSIRLVRSGGIYDFVNNKFNYVLTSFSLEGQGNIPSSTYTIHLNAGKTYTLRLLNTFSTSTVVSGRNKYSLGYTINGSWTAVFTTQGSETEITAGDYTFTAIECDSYEILIRGDVGETANFRILTLADDLTDVVEAIGTSNNTDIISLNDENRTLRYLRSIKRPNYSQDGRYTAGVTPFTLLHFSDLHSDVSNLKRIVEYKEHYADYIDDAICTGDNIRNVFGDSYDFWSASGADDILISTGNHEYYNGESSNYYQSITPKQVYDKFFAPFISSWGNVVFPENASMNGYNYYYKDYTSQKVRLIVLDNMANMKGERNGVQAAWLATVLESARTSNLHVLCAIHIASTLETVFENPFTSYNIIRNSDSGVNSGSFSEFYTLRDAVETFITNGGNFIGWIGGHRHADSIAILTGYQQGAIHVATASSGHAWNIIPLGDDCDRTDGTKQQDSFNIYSVDTEQRTLRIFKVGSDIDRNGRHKGMLLYNYGDHTVKHYD